MHAVDVSEASVNKTRRVNAQSVRQGRVFVRQWGVDDLEYPEGTFDVATAFETLYFWPHPESGLKRIHGLLKPGGRLVISMEIYMADGKIVNMPDSFRELNMNLFSEQDLAALCGQAGFVSCRAELGRRIPWMRFEALKAV